MNSDGSSQVPTDEEVAAAFRDGCGKAATRLGFAVRQSGFSALAAERRIRLVQSRTRAAQELIIDLQQWLSDDDMRVRKAARGGLRSITHRLYTGDRNELDDATAARRRTDGLVAAALGPADQDGPAPWWDRAVAQERVRSGFIGAALIFLLVGAGCLASGHVLIALVPILFGGLFDIAEGSFSRVVGLRNASLRWLSCICSHVTDLCLVIATAVATAETGRSSAAIFVGVGAIITLFGSFVRVSALQAGYRFWVSPQERLVRYVAVAEFVPVYALGHVDLAAFLCASLLCVGGVLEVWKVIRSVSTGPQITEGTFVFIDAQHDLHELAWYDGASETPDIHDGRRRRGGDQVEAPQV